MPLHPRTRLQVAPLPLSLALPALPHLSSAAHACSQRYRTGILQVTMPRT
jgi:hypothetical protein